ncbi:MULTISPECIES: hypothetical protein [unclassified Pseudarthrobacter]|uniref:hypothetical protein n=1 Tax=unclassified Pseudarthrobacter TaxID=2647000 RepID=UPI0030787F07
MTTKSTHPVMSMLEWGATISGVLAVVGFFVPGGITKDFLLANPLWGWSGFVLLLIVSRGYIHVAVKARAKDVEADLARKWKDRESELVQKLKNKEAELIQERQTKEDGRKSRTKDLSLLEERMKGWEMHGPFQVSLAHAFHKRLPSNFVRQLEEQIDRWDLDTRDFHNQDVAQTWEACKSAAEEYRDKINYYMSYEEGKNNEYLEVSTYSRDHGEGDHYRMMFKELEDARSGLQEALGGVYKVLHSSV